MTSARVFASRIEPAQSASVVGDGVKLWEGRIIGADWTHVVAVMSVNPVAIDDTWGGYVWLQLGSDAAEQSTDVYLFEPNPHLVIEWEPSALADGEYVSIMAAPHAAGVSMWVDSCVLTLSDELLDVGTTPSVEVYVPPPDDGILTEGGLFILTESGDRILLEA